MEGLNSSHWWKLCSENCFPSASRLWASLRGEIEDGVNMFSVVTVPDLHPRVNFLDSEEKVHRSFLTGSIVILNHFLQIISIVQTVSDRGTQICFLKFHIEHEDGIAPGSTVDYDQCLGGSPPGASPTLRREIEPSAQSCLPLVSQSLSCLSLLAN